MKLISIVWIVLLGVDARKGFGPGEQEWGYVDVRPGAHMFWWLYYTTDTSVLKSTDRPLLIWLQGGPGASSTGYGNFEEFGPLDINLRPRNETWMNKYNVLLVDNPVGSGFSYVDETSLLTRDNSQIGKDLVELLKGFYGRLPEFKSTPLFVTSESYGGKMAVEFALELFKQESEGKFKSNIKGVVLIDSWISPIDSVLTWAPFLLHTGLVDDAGFDRINTSAYKCKKFIDEEKWASATKQWGLTEGIIMNETTGVDFYNILTKIPAYKFNDLLKLISTKDLLYENHVHLRTTRTLDSLMNNDVKVALEIPENVEWGGQSAYVFKTLERDFMKPVTDVVETLLNSTEIKVYVVSGQLDLIVDTLGTYNWAKKIQFKGSDAFLSNNKRPFDVDNYIDGYVKTGGNFAFYWIHRSGHMVPLDNPRAMNQVLQELEDSTTKVY